MKQLILDNLQRRHLEWLLVCLVSLIIGLTAAPMVEPLNTLGKPAHPGDTSFFTTPIIMVFACQFSTMGVGLVAGFARVALTLPISTRTLARSFWVIRVVVPTVLLGLFGGFGLFAAGSWPNFPGDFGRTWLELVFLGGLASGSSFWFFSGSPEPPPTKSHQMLMRVYSVAFSLALIGGGYALYKSPWSAQIKYWVICLFGLGFTLLGWQRAEGLVVDCGGYRPQAGPKNSDSRQGLLPAGFGGMQRLLATSFLRQFQAIGSATLVYAVILGYEFYKHGQIPTAFKAANFSVGVVPWIIFSVCYQELSQSLLHLSFLRTMPLSARQLSAGLLAIGLFTYFVTVGLFFIVNAMFQEHMMALAYDKAAIAGFATISIFVVTAIWHKEYRPGRILLAGFVLCVSLVIPVYQVATNGPGFPMWVMIAYAAGAVTLAWWAICYLLEKNDTTYISRDRLSHDVFANQ